MHTQRRLHIGIKGNVRIHWSGNHCRLRYLSPCFKNFDDIDESHNFDHEFITDKRYVDKSSGAMFAAVRQKLALRFKEKDISYPVQALETTQIIETFRLHEN